MTPSTPANRLTLLFGLVALASVTLLLPACSTWDGHFTVLGYSTRPNYDTKYRTVSIPIFKNRTYWVVTPVPGMEMDLTRAVIREIELKTPYKVVQNNADTELKGTIVNFTKTLLNYTPFNTIREAETTMTVELVWRDLRTGEVLTRASRRPGQPRDADPRQPLLAAPETVLPPGMRPVPPVSPAALPTSGVVTAGEEDDVIIDPATQKKAIPVVVRSTAHFKPELGESLTTALQKNYDRVAVQITQVLETGW